MAAFIAKQMVGNQLKSVKGAIGENKEEGEGAQAQEVEDPEVVEARREAEEKRKEKHRKMEEERENMRQGIRDKYGLKKREPEAEPLQEQGTEGRIGRKKKTAAELAAEANADDEESKMPTSLSEFSAKVSELPSKVAQSVGEVTEKCCVQ